MRHPLPSHRGQRGPDALEVGRHFNPGKTIALHFKQDYGVVVFDTKAGILKGINQYKSPTLMSEEVLSPDAHGYTNIGEALEIGIGEMESYPKKIGVLLGLDVW